MMLFLTIKIKYENDEHIPEDLLLVVLDIEGALLAFSKSDSDGSFVDILRLSANDCGLCTLVLSLTEGAAVVCVLSTEAFGRIRLLQSSNPLDA